MTDAIDAARQILEQRLREIDDEARRLEAGLKGLTEVPSVPAPRRRKRRRRSARKAASSSAQNGAKPAPSKKVTRKPSARKSTRRAPRGERAEQFLAAVKESPGASASELARAIGVSPTQGHALARRLHKKRAITKRGKGYSLPKTSK